mgnify:CR=1 FL=1|tara:strand:- start:14664 stop:15083 length:420 start_codon:yes stop_codon:yes gene_type:complete
MLILYTTEDGKSQIKLRAAQQTVWLTQLEMAELFDASKQNISLHLKNLVEDGELDAAATVKESLTVQVAGGRQPTTEKSSVVGPALHRMGMEPLLRPSVPRKRESRSGHQPCAKGWIPACAGMTDSRGRVEQFVGTVSA